MERTREFGVLMAVGMRPGQVRLMVLIETLYMGVLALICGVLIGLGLSFYMAVIGIDLSGTLTPITYAGGTILPRLHAVIEPANIIIPAICLLLICLCAGFFPPIERPECNRSLRSGRIDGTPFSGLENLWRNRRRTLITLAALSFSLMLIQAVHNLSFGVYRTMIDSGVRAGTGHLVVYQQGYLGSRDERLTFNPGSLTEELSRIDGVQAVLPRLYLPGLAQSSRESRGILLTGVVPDMEKS